ncbi:hypothetical protein GIB67_018366 [Kingdonia uniflora]|uniref:Dof zinc finger protein n=1 Tax=Kingdonia uniflora TaxID=39325 RepID=A0A7J7MJ44_9MAGN|nr:hypothetical protein GIB67_018366 [Kingdonia uniflora]
MFPSNSGPMMIDRRWKTNIEVAPNCPRCASTNTKFCYYNNYSLSQPRYFCKGCRRYWTKGGSLRNVPFGGGCRKKPRGKSVRIIPEPGQGRSSSVYGCSESGYDGVGGDPFGNSGSSDPNQTSSGSDIDLAVVFSKFLNHDPCLDLPNSSNPSYDSSVTEFPVDLCQKSTEVSPDSQLMSSSQEVFLPEFDPNKRISQFVEPGPNSFGLTEDELWSDNSSFSWQTPQLQEFEPVLDDHLTFHQNLLHGNWSSFDIPSYGT